MKIGVLALQGAFEEHIKMLGKLNAVSVEIRQLSDLEQDFDGFIIPGGESTVISKLLNELNMRDKLLEKINSGATVFGTCAGLIMMAEKTGDPKARPLKLMEFTAKRNAYGRQLGSFSTTADFGKEGKIPMVFIRAPYISEASPTVEILSTVDGKIVAARQDRFLATAFHPELTDDLTVHKYFLNMIAEG
ncbi:MAG: pyridoxal 5'-phosphate synthase glutaminase subunit PdxT [Eubacterium sp.]